MKRHVLSALAVLAMVSAYSGCDTTVVYTDPYVSSWYDVYGYYCGSSVYPAPGCNYYSDGTKIVDFEDPYYSSNHFLSWNTWQYTDSYGLRAYYTGYGWLSPTGILYDDWGRALNNKDQESDGRDLIGEVAAQEEAAITASAEHLSERFTELQSDKARDIAVALNDWAVLGKKRARSAQDIKLFGKRIAGVDTDKAMNALASAKSGDVSSLTELNTTVAAFWGTSPETSAAILKSWYARKK